MNNPSAISIAMLAWVMAACATRPETPATCSHDAVDATRSPASLRAIQAVCPFDSEVKVAAILKLNRLPAPAVRSFSLGPSVALPEAERVTYELDVFYNFLETYPPDEGFKKLSELIASLDTAFLVESVSITGSSDSIESAAKTVNFAHRRAEFLKEFFVAAGLPSLASVRLLETGPQNPHTPEGNARNRSAAIKVVALRRRSNAP